MKNQLIEIDYYSIGDYNFCAKIYHKGLDEKQEKRCFNKSQLESEVERSIKRLNLKWELLQFIQLEKFLIDGLVISIEIKLEEFKRNDKFEEPHPENIYKSKFDELKYPDKLELKQLPERLVEEELKDKPQKEYFTPSYNLFDLIFGKEKKRMISEQWFNDCLQDWTIESEKANNHYQETLKQWEIEYNLIENENKKIQDDYEKSLNDYESKKKSLAKQRNDAISCWNQQKTEFFQPQEKYNRQLDEVKRSYSNLDLSVVAEYSVLILENSKYPSFIKKNFEVDYNPENKILVVEYALPPIDVIPTLKDVKLVKGEWKEYYISEVQAMKNFENTLYSIALRTLYELFQRMKLMQLMQYALTVGLMQ